MHVRSMSSCEPEVIELVWSEPDVRAFWIAEARQIVGLFGFL